MNLFIKFAICGIVCSTLLAVNFQAALAQTAQWTFNSPNPTGTQGLEITNLKHSSNLLVSQVDLPYVRVIYPDSGRFVTDQLGNGGFSNQNHYEKHDSAGPPAQTMWHTRYFVGCLPADWPLYSCYKYEQIYYFIDSGTTSTKFRPYLKISGEGFTEDEGLPIYQPHWRLNTDIPSSSVGDVIQRWTGSAWSTISTEGVFSPATLTGQQFKTWDNNVGSSKSFGVQPLLSAGTAGDRVTALRYHAGEDDPTSSGYYNEESIWVNGESVQNADIVVWYRHDESAGTNWCNSVTPCTVGATWIPNGGL